jgi:hypothetical protein
MFMDQQTEALERNAPAPGHARSIEWQKAVLLLLVGWFLLSQAYSGATNPASAITGWDFRVLYDAAARLNKGEELYSITGNAEGKTPYIYTPLIAQAFRPLAHLPLEKAVKAWFFISAGCLVLSVAVYAAAAGFTLAEIVPLCVMLVVGFRFWPMVFNFGLGQINNLLLLCACAMFWAERRDRSKLAGFLIALAALIKLWMFGILIYPLVKRNWKASLSSVLFYCAGLVVLFIPGGLGAWKKFCAVTVANAEQPFLISQSILGFARLQFAANTHIHALMPSKALFFTFLVLGYLAVGASFVYLWSRGGSKSPYETRLWFGVCLLSIPLVSPLCHDEYYILALPLLWALLTAPKSDPAGWRIGSAAAALVLYALLMRPWPTSGEGLSAHNQGPSSLLATAFFILGGAVWLLGVLSIVIARAKAAHASEGVPSALPLSVPARS